MNKQHKVFSKLTAGLLGSTFLLALNSHGTIIDATLLSMDRITGEGSPNSPAGYYVDGGSNVIGVTGSNSGQTRRISNQLFGFELPTLGAGETIESVTFSFFVNDGRNQSTNLGNLDVYLLDIADPTTTGLSLFFEADNDPSADVEFVGQFDNPGGVGNGNTDISQAVVMQLSGSALTLFESFYSGATPTQTEAFFRLNLDVDADKAVIDRYRIETDSMSPNFVGLQIETAVIPEPAHAAVLIGGALSALCLLVRRRFGKQ